MDAKQNALVLKNCCFSRLPFSSSGSNEAAGKNGLKNISLSIRKGELVGLLGGMASGKSTLVTSLINFILLPMFIKSTLVHFLVLQYGIIIP